LHEGGGGDGVGVGGGRLNQKKFAYTSNSTLSAETTNFARY